MIRKLLASAVRGLTRNTAVTSPTAEDPRLRGRTYAIPFEQVWRISLALVGGGLKRWELLEADDEEGVIRGLAHGPGHRFTSAITLRITLDRNAQTRVDALAASRVGRADFGSNARRLDLYFTTLDQRLEDARGSRIETLRLEAPAAVSG